MRVLSADREGGLACLTEYVRTAPQSKAQIANLPWFRTLHGESRFEALVQSAP